MTEPDHDHDHDHDHHHHHHPDAADPAIRTEAIEQLLLEKGLVTTERIDALIHQYETEIGPLNGATVVARAWLDPDYRARLLADGTAGIAELGFGGAQGERLVVLENTDLIHNVVVCTLCSCYPWPVLGLPPSWYKSPEYRARAVREPRAVLAEFGTELPDDVQIRVWDSSAEVRYLVLPQRPVAAVGDSIEALTPFVSRDSMIGVRLAGAAG